MNDRKRLSDILRLNPEQKSLHRVWEETEAAGDFEPLPAGEYPCRIVCGELFNAKKGTPGYKLTFEVTEGEFADRRIWHDLWLTTPALPMSKRDLAKIGVTHPEQLEQPVPPGILVKVKLALRKDDDGNTFNKVKSFEVIGEEKGDAFAPPEDAGADTSFDPTVLEQDGSAEEPSAADLGQPPSHGKSGGSDGPYRGERY
jgi:hypothetical protein